MIPRLLLPGAVVGGGVLLAMDEDRFSRALGVGALASLSFGFWVLFKAVTDTEEGWRGIAQDAVRGNVVGLTWTSETTMIAIRAIEELAEHDPEAALLLNRDLRDAEARYSEMT